VSHNLTSSIDRTIIGQGRLRNEQLTEENRTFIYGATVYFLEAAFFAGAVFFAGAAFFAGVVFFAGAAFFAAAFLGWATFFTADGFF